MLSKFAQGMLVTMAFTTPEGKNITEKALKVGLKVGEKVIQARYGIDIRKLLNEVVEEDKSDE